MITTVWADHLGTETRHTRQIDSHVTLCGLGTNNTRNFSRHPREDHRCQRCQAEVDAMNHTDWAESNERRWADREQDDAEYGRIDSLNFPSNRSW